MIRKPRLIDNIDVEILGILQKDCRIKLGEIARKLGIPKSTVYYRIKRLEAQKIIRGYHARVDAAKLGKDYTAIVSIRTKHSSGYQKKVGDKLAQIAGVWATYFVFGEEDFIVLTLSDNREELMKIVEKISNIDGVERTNTTIVGKILGENPIIQLNLLRNNNETEIV